MGEICTVIPLKADIAGGLGVDDEHDGRGQGQRGSGRRGNGKSEQGIISSASPLA